MKTETNHLNLLKHYSTYIEKDFYFMQNMLRSAVLNFI